MELLLSSNDLLFNEIILWSDFKLRLLVFDKLLVCLVEQSFSHLGILGRFGILNVQNDELMHRIGVATVQIGLQGELFEQELKCSIVWPGKVIRIVIFVQLYLKLALDL